jgi:membrane protein implicated in regulation of membrane protease activity
VVGRYAVLQLPELLLVGAALTVLAFLDVVTAGVAWLLFGLWILKEIVLFPVVRRAYETSDGGGAADLVGARAIVIERLDPEGRVRLGPESWIARLPAGSTPAEVGTTVCVKSVEGLTLHVVTD